jgi:uncharacterized membrane protein
MRRVRFSIAGMMGLVAFLAVAWAAIRFGVDAGIRSQVLSLVALSLGIPMPGLLALGLVVLLRRRRRPEEVPPGLRGALAFGGMATILYVIGSMDRPEGTVWAIEWVLNRLITPLEAMIEEPSSTEVSILLAALIVFFPQALFACAGAWLAKRYEVRIVIQRRRPALHREIGPLAATAQGATS